MLAAGKRQSSAHGRWEPQIMKVTVEIDCTPSEARQFFGLPDVQPMQALVMAEVEKKVLAQMETFSPDGLMRAWFSAMPQNAEWVRDMFSGLFPQGRPDHNKPGS
jgi:hypothetical protein